MIKKHHLLALIAACSIAFPATAQTCTDAESTKTVKAFNNLEVTINAGSTGIGFDFATYVHKMVRIRTGFDFTPKITPTLNFAIEGGRYDENGNWVPTQFDTMAKTLEEFTGYKTDDKVAMKGEPTFWNYKLLVDVFPFKNKNWHVTAGFYLGPSRIAKAYNKTEEMASLLAVGIYNNIYDKIMAGEPIYGDNVYLDPDIEDKFIEYGRMGIRVGDHKSDGTPYLMEPDETGMVKANMKANTFRPYLGFGYSGRMIKNNDKYYIGFECGAMFWGGTPELITHDGTNLTKDVKNIMFSVGDYVDVIKKFKVYPVINLRITRKLF